MKFMTILLSFVVCFTLVSNACALELRHGALLDVDEGEIEYITAATVYQWKKLNVDLWAVDVDRLINLQEEFTVGIAAAYNLGKLSDYSKYIKKIPVIEVIDEYIDFSVGYALGIENPLTHDCELKRGFYTIGMSISF